MRKIYELLLFIVGSSVGWNLALVKPSFDGGTKVLTPWFAGIIKGGDIWDGKVPLGSAARPCRWKNATLGSKGFIVELCLDGYDQEPNTECDEAWQIVRNLNQDGIYVNVGSSLGYCALRILLDSALTVIAVEPHPVKLFHLTSTLLKLNASLRERIIVLPIAAGYRDDTAFLFSGDRNYGPDVDARFRGESLEVPIHRLDRVLSSLNTIRLVHVDTGGGMECSVLQGLSELQQVNSLLFETHEQEQNNCTKSGLIEIVQKLGLSLNFEEDCMRHMTNLVCTVANSNKIAR
jgi:FkbM family methyltransferase